MRRPSASYCARGSRATWRSYAATTACAWSCRQWRRHERVAGAQRRIHRLRSVILEAVPPAHAQAAAAMLRAKGAVVTTVRWAGTALNASFLGGGSRNGDGA
jgi:hypothetical protein